MVLSFEDTPLFDWLRKNRFFLLGLAVLVVGIQGYNYYAPGIKYSKQAEAWNLFETIAISLGTDFDANLSADLSRAEAYPTIYPWVVFAATNQALGSDNTLALDTLKPKLSALVQDERVSGYKAIPASGEVTNIAAVLLAQVEDKQSHSVKSWSNPEPTGAKVKIVITDSDGNTYDMVAGLYEGIAPSASSAFITAVDEGLLIGKDVTSTGGAFSLRDYNPEATDSLPLERQYGYFHMAGALATSVVPGEPGQQEPDALTVYLQDATRADGSTTVFGSVTEGLEALQEAMATPGIERTFAITEASVL
ncbi:MAG: peptidylprolyl isomerase [Planctomycetota bacterium]